MKTLAEIKDHLKSILPTGVDLTIEAIKAQLVEGTDQYNDLILLEGRYREVGRQLLQGVTSNEDAQIEFNKIRKDLLAFIDTIQESHLANRQGSSDDRPDIYNGEVFYRIPTEMQLEKESRCIVRLAFDRNIIMEGLEMEEGDVLEDLRISEVMGVEVLDAHGNCFAIRTLHDTIQFVDKDLHTEWVFFVKPIATGTHPLTLKISIIEVRNGIERKRNVVMEEQVVVVTEPVPEEEGEMKKAGYAMHVGQSAASNPTPAPPAAPSQNIQPASPRSPSPSPAAPPKSSGRSFRKMAPMVTGVFAIIFASWAAFSGGFFDGGGGVTQPVEPGPGFDINESASIEPAPVEPSVPEVMTIEEFWEWTRTENTRGAYEEFVASIEEQAYLDMANEKLDSIETVIYQAAMVDGTIAAAQVYLDDYPEGKYAGRVQGQIDKLRQLAENRNKPATSNETTSTSGAKNTSKASRIKSKANTQAKNKSPETSTGDKKPAVETAVSLRRASRKPIYPGCRNNKKRDKEVRCTENKIRGFLGDRLKYPKVALRDEIEGTVQVVFVVEKDGSITDVHALRGPGGGCEEEAVRLVKALPKFEPGQNRAGEAIRVKYHLPITFRLR